MRDIFESAKSIGSYMVDLRREFHKRPELAFNEFETSRRIKSELSSMGIPYESVTETGVVADIDGGYPGRTVALRADIDALAIQELTECEFKSQTPGVMHACGHDGHTAALLGAAKLLKENSPQLKGRVRLIFQPAEELVKGAMAMLDEKDILSGVDGVFAIHLMPDYPCGVVGYKNGPFFSTGERFTIEVSGVGGHGSQPHKTVDALLVSSAIVMNLQSILSHEIDPRKFAVTTVGELKSGTFCTIIPGDATITGTLRCYEDDVYNVISEAIQRIAEHTAKAYRAEAKVIFSNFTPAVINDDDAIEIMRGAASRVVGGENVIRAEASTASDDVAYFFKKKPGCYVFVGCGNSHDNYAIHHPMYSLNEDSLPVACALYAQYAIDYLRR